MRGTVAFSLKWRRFGYESGPMDVLCHRLLQWFGSGR